MYVCMLVYGKLRRTFKIAGKTISKAGFDNKCWNPGKRGGILAGKCSQTALTNSSRSPDLPCKPSEEQPGTNELIELRGTISNTATVQPTYHRRAGSMLARTSCFPYLVDTRKILLVVWYPRESRTKSSIDRSTSEDLLINKWFRLGGTIPIVIEVEQVI